MKKQIPVTLVIDDSHLAIPVSALSERAQAILKDEPYVLLLCGPDPNLSSLCTHLIEWPFDDLDKNSKDLRQSLHRLRDLGMLKSPFPPCVILPDGTEFLIESAELKPKVCRKSSPKPTEPASDTATAPVTVAQLARRVCRHLAEKENLHRRDFPSFGTPNDQWCSTRQGDVVLALGLALSAIQTCPHADWDQCVYNMLDSLVHTILLRDYEDACDCTDEEHRMVDNGNEVAPVSYYSDLLPPDNLSSSLSYIMLRNHRGIVSLLTFQRDPKEPVSVSEVDTSLEQREVLKDRISLLHDAAAIVLYEI